MGKARSAVADARRMGKESGRVGCDRAARSGKRSPRTPHNLIISTIPHRFLGRFFIVAIYTTHAWHRGSRKHARRASGRVAKLWGGSAMDQRLQCARQQQNYGSVHYIITPSPRSGIIVTPAMRPLAGGSPSACRSETVLACLVHSLPVPCRCALPDCREEKGSTSPGR